MLKKYNFGQRLSQNLWYGLILGIALCIGSCTPTYKSVTTLSRLTVGKTLVPYPHGSGDKFRVVLLHSELPPVCTTEKCGVFGPMANRIGIDLYGGSDGKLADQIFGIFPEDNEAYRKQSQKYGVLIIADPQDKIRAIYQHVHLSDVETILQKSEAIFAQAD